MGTIKKIEVFDDKTKKTTTYEESTYEGDFESLILHHLPDYDIQHYAENELDMIEEDECPTCNCSIEDYNDDDLIEIFKERGHFAIKIESIVDSMKAEELKNLMTA